MGEINVTFEMIKEAEKFLKEIIHHPPLQYSQTYTDMVGSRVFLKPENLQKAGSYKIRGAYNKLRTLNEEERKRGVMTASAGNHAQGLALAARMAGINATVFMPKTAPLAKVEATMGYGARVIQTGNNFDETTSEALKWQKEHQALFISPFNDDYIIAGQGTIGLEILEECPDVKNIVVPIGGGGVISGIAIAVKTLRPEVKIFGVQASGAPTYYNSFHNRKLSPIKTSDTIADGINIKEPVERTLDIMLKYVDDIFTVDDEEISEAMLYLLERSKLVTEAAGAVALSSLLSRKLKVNGDTVVLVSGGNVDIKMIDSIVQRGLVKSGRYLKFITMISDSPGSLYKLLGVLSEQNVSIINITHDRLRRNLKIGQTEVEVSVETKNWKHNEQVVSILKDSGYDVVII